MAKQRKFILNTNLRWFLLAMILANIAGQMGNSMMSLYLVDLGGTVPQVGLVFTLAALVPVASYPIYLSEIGGLAFGLFGTSLGLLSLPFPWIGAQLWARVGPQAPFWLTVVASAKAIPIAARALALPERRQSDAAGEQA